MGFGLRPLRLVSAMVAAEAAHRPMQKVAEGWRAKQGREMEAAAVMAQEREAATVAEVERAAEMAREDKVTVAAAKLAAVTVAKGGRVGVTKVA